MVMPHAKNDILKITKCCMMQIYTIVFCMMNSSHAADMTSKVSSTVLICYIYILMHVLLISIIITSLAIGKIISQYQWTYHEKYGGII